MIPFGSDNGNIAELETDPDLQAPKLDQFCRVPTS
jgi:hypothetical protein